MSFTYKYLLNDNIVEKGEANLPPSTLVYLAEQAVSLNKKIFFSRHKNSEYSLVIEYSKHEIIFIALD